MGATRNRVPVKEILSYFQKKNDYLYSILAEWNSWQSWGPCSVTCDYGVRQRSRTCSIPSQCSGLGPAVDTDYCTAADCHGMAKGKKKRENKWDFVSYRTCVSYFPGTLMKKYSVGSFAKSEFLSSSALVDSNPTISQKLSCLHSCLGQRPHRHQFGQCNSFMLLPNGQCRLGYQVWRTSISFKKITKKYSKFEI